MKRSRSPRRGITSRLAMILALTACASAGRVPSPATAQSTGPASSPRTPAERARADSGRAPYTTADVQFMEGMIAHHAQAVVMAGWAPTHGARQDVAILASRIDVGQRDEIAFMQRWLRDRHLTVPDALAHDMSGHDMSSHDTTMSGMTMPGLPAPGTLMPGMLTPAQMSQLSAATGAEFDRLFLTFMIQHHQGALTMVNRLFASPGAGQEEYVFRFASDVSTDQTTEIERMQSMLSHTSAGRSP